MSPVAPTPCCGWADGPSRFPSLSSGWLFPLGSVADSDTPSGLIAVLPPLSPRDARPIHSLATPATVRARLLTAVHVLWGAASDTLSWALTAFADLVAAARARCAAAAAAFAHFAAACARCDVCKCLALESRRRRSARSLDAAVAAVAADAAAALALSAAFAAWVACLAVLRLIIFDSAVAAWSLARAAACAPMEAVHAADAAWAVAPRAAGLPFPFRLDLTVIHFSSTLPTDAGECCLDGTALWWRGWWSSMSFDASLVLWAARAGGWPCFDS